LIEWHVWVSECVRTAEWLSVHSLSVHMSCRLIERHVWVSVCGVVISSLTKCTHELQVDWVACVSEWVCADCGVVVSPLTKCTHELQVDWAACVSEWVCWVVVSPLTQVPQSHMRISCRLKFAGWDSVCECRSYIYDEVQSLYVLTWWDTCSVSRIPSRVCCIVSSWVV